MSIPFADRVATLRVRPSLPDHRNALYGAAPGPLLPPAASLGVTLPVKDQGRQGSCTGHGYSSMVEALIMAAGRPYDAKSRAFIYAEERLMENDLDQDAGAEPIDGCKVLASLGVPSEIMFPYNDAVFNLFPPAALEKDPGNIKIAGYALASNAAQVKTAIYQGHAVGFGIAVYESFERVGADGVVPMPGKSEAPLGGHWVFGGLAYQDDASAPGGGYFECQNSWGDSWGKQGHMFIPYAYVDNSDYCFECRVIWL